MLNTTTLSVDAIARAGILNANDRAAAKAELKLQHSRRINAESHDRRVMLKIKLKSLADEARAIRREELLRQGGWLRLELREHRLGNRGEARATHLAYGFLRGRTRASMERPSIAAEYGLLRDRVRAMVKKYGPAGAVVPDDWFTA